MGQLYDQIMDSNKIFIFKKVGQEEDFHTLIPKYCYSIKGTRDAALIPGEIENLHWNVVFLKIYNERTNA